jgi:hypothetical protein
MSFRSTDDLPPNPHVRIFFVGQLVLEPLIHAKGCEVFINRSAPDHHLSIEVRKKKLNKPDEIIMRHFGPLPFAQADEGAPLHHGMFIEVLPGETLVKGYNGRNPSPEGEELDLALNMTRIHDVSCEPVEPIGGRPSILITQATFYTADTFPAGATLQKNRPGSWPKPQPKFAGIIGANIYLPNATPQQGQYAEKQPGDQQPADARVVMTWRPNGRDVSLTFDRVANQTHEIYISNEPLFQDDDVTAPFAHDEFSEFYKILRNVPNHEQFILKTPPPSRGSLRTPCMSVLLNQ